MDLLDINEVNRLIEQRGKEPSISIYMPTQKAADTAQNPIRFKNMLNKVEERLSSKELGSKQEIKELLEPAHRLTSDSIFWSNQSEGLALFISPDFMHYYRLPVEFKELVVVANYFHIKPLLSLLSEDGQFYVLALSQKKARLLRGTRTLAEEMNLSPLIQKFEEKYGKELPEQYLQFHTQAPRKGETRAAVHFGHGGEIDNIRKERLLKYFRFLDKELYGLFYRDGAPLILACVDDLVSLYRKANSYSNLLDENIKGNPDKIKTQELHQRAWELVNPIFKEDRGNAIAKYYELKGTGKTSNELNEVLPASYYGRVGTLFVPRGTQQWGSCNFESGQISLSDKPEINDEDLLGLAAAETFINNGSVYTVNPEEIPDNKLIAAVFRY